MKINSGTFLSYLQLKESENNCVQRLVEQPQEDQFDIDTAGQNPGISLDNLKDQQSKDKQPQKANKSDTNNVPSQNNKSVNNDISIENNIINISNGIKIDVQNGIIEISNDKLLSEVYNNSNKSVKTELDTLNPNNCINPIYFDTFVVQKLIVEPLTNKLNTDYNKKLQTQISNKNKSSDIQGNDTNNVLTDAQKHEKDILDKVCDDLDIRKNPNECKNFKFQFPNKKLGTLVFIKKPRYNASNFAKVNDQADGMILIDTKYSDIFPNGNDDKILLNNSSSGIIGIIRSEMPTLPFNDDKTHHIILKDSNGFKTCEQLPKECETLLVENCADLEYLTGAPEIITNAVSIIDNPKLIEDSKSNWSPKISAYVKIKGNNNLTTENRNILISTIKEKNENVTIIDDASLYDDGKYKTGTLELYSGLTTTDLSNDLFFQEGKNGGRILNKNIKKIIFKTSKPIFDFSNLKTKKPYLESFENFPTDVFEGSIILSGNQRIKSLKGIPKEINGDLILDNTGINTINYLPENIKGDLNLSNCKQLTDYNSNKTPGDIKQTKIDGIMEVSNTPLFNKIDPNVFSEKFEVKGKIVGNDKLGSNNQNTEKIIANSNGTYTCVESVGYEDLIVYVEGYDAKTNKATGKKFSVKFKEAKKDFDISGLPITTFEGCPKKVGGSFNRREGKWLTGEWKHPNASTVSITDNNLKDAPDEVGGSFIVVGCKSIKSLEGAPNKCKNFSANDTSIKNLKGGPADVEGFYYVRDCKDLESLEGLPNKVGDLFSIRGCKKLNGSKKSQNIKLLKAKLTKKDYGRIEWPDAGSLKAGVKSALKGVWDKVKLFSVDDVKDDDDDKKDDKNDQKKQ